jgi:hypothetical protein
VDEPFTGRADEWHVPKDRSQRVADLAQPSMIYERTAFGCYKEASEPFFDGEG